MNTGYKVDDTGHLKYKGYIVLDGEVWHNESWWQYCRSYLSFKNNEQALQWIDNNGTNIGVTNG